MRQSGVGILILSLPVDAFFVAQNQGNDIVLGSGRNRRSVDGIFQIASQMCHSAHERRRVAVFHHMINIDVLTVDQSFSLQERSKIHIAGHVGSPDGLQRQLKRYIVAFTKQIVAPPSGEANGATSGIFIF